MKIQCRKLPSIIIGCMYRHPKAHCDSFDYIVDLVQAMTLRNKSLFILGDLNDDLLNNSSKISRILKNNKLTQIINQPTRITPTSATLLDVVITNTPDSVLTSEVVPHPVADHDLVSVTVDISKGKRPRDFKSFRDLS